MARPAFSSLVGPLTPFIPHLPPPSAPFLLSTPPSALSPAQKERLAPKRQELTGILNDDTL